MNIQYAWLAWSSALLLLWIGLCARYPRQRLAMWRTCVSDVLLFGPPLEELLALTFGFYWKAAYEHFAWLSVTDGSRGA